MKSIPAAIVVALFCAVVIISYFKKPSYIRNAELTSNVNFSSERKDTILESLGTSAAIN